MRNWLKATMLLLAVTAMMATPALAAEYEFDDSDGPVYAPPTSVDQVIVVGGGVTESSNIDRSKNTAVIAPALRQSGVLSARCRHDTDPPVRNINWQQHHQR